MVRKVVDVKQGELPASEPEFTRRSAEEPGGQKSERPYELGSACNGRGAKGRRKVDA
jgi:hypothetical protein